MFNVGDKVKLKGTNPLVVGSYIAYPNQVYNVESFRVSWTNPNAMQLWLDVPCATTTFMTTKYYFDSTFFMTLREERKEKIMKISELHIQE